MAGKHIELNLFTTLPLAASIAVICGAATLAHADDFTKRFYLGAGVGVTQLEPESPSDSLTISDDTDAGGHIALGYDINRFLSVEAYAGTLGSAEVDFLGTDIGSVDYTVYGISALGYLVNSRSGLILGDNDTSGLFRREGASLYGRFGIGHMSNDSTNVSYKRDYPNHVVFGLGLEYGFESGFALRTEWIGMDTDAQYLNIGVLKRFGNVGQAAPVALAAPVVAAAVAAEPRPATPAPAKPEAFKPARAPVAYFVSDSSVLPQQAVENLDELAEELKNNDKTVQIEGNTDWLAPEAYNMSLSVRRAESVANYLVSKGIDRDRIRTVGHGETKPVSNNDTPEGRALNRRTEIIVK